MKKITLFGHQFEFFWSEPKINSQPIKIRLLINITTFLLFITMVDAYFNLDGVISIPVTAHNVHFWNNKDFSLPGNNFFTTGQGSGILHWHPQNIGQALILKSANSESVASTDIFHVGLLYLFVLVFYLMTKNNESSTLFTKKVSRGFRAIFLMITISVILESQKHRFLNDYIEKMTHGQFGLPQVTPPWFYFWLGIMLLVLTRFTDRAAELQQEAELTI